jgi:nucleotide-binding universal stress UspA family protein
MTMERNARPVVVGLDGTNDGLNAARWAAAVAARLGAPIQLVHVMRGVDEALLVLTAPEQADAGAYPRELAQAVLDRAADAVHEVAPELHVSRKLSHRTPEQALTELSRRARMVVLACADVSPGGAVLVGSTTLAVATHSACPVVAWRGAALGPTEAPVVVGVDENRISQAALTTAFELADGLGVELAAVYAMPQRRAPGEIDIPFIVDWQELEDQARLRLSELVTPTAARFPNVRVSYSVELGRASRTILRHAGQAQLVVVGSRGRGELASALLGSTGLSLLHHSPVPVVLCPTAHAEDEPAEPEQQAKDPAAAGSH